MAGINKREFRFANSMFSRKRLPGRKSKRQAETILQKEIIEALHKLGLGYFFRIRNGATFDPKAGIFRSNTTVKGIPDIVGYTTLGRAVFVEVKFISGYDERKLIKHRNMLSQEQKQFLNNAHKCNAIAGVAYNMQDAIDIVNDNPIDFPRHARTYDFLPKAEKNEMKSTCKEDKRVLSEKKKDPIYHIVSAQMCADIMEDE